MREGWEYKRWADVLTIINGKNQKAVESPNGQYPIYGSGGIMGYALDWLCPENCVIIGRKGNINKPLFVESKFWNVDTAFGLSANQECLIPKYLFYFCLDYNFERHNRAVTIPSLTKIDLLKVKMLVPPKPTQLSIVSELDKLNELIQIKKEQLKDYDALAQSIFYEMFGDPVVNEKGWEVMSLGDICEITSSKRVFANEYVDMGVPFYRSKEVIEKSKQLPISVELYISESHYDKIKSSFGVPQIGDILVTAVGTIGKIWVVDTNEPFYFKDGNLVWLRNIKGAHCEYFRYSLFYLIDEYKKVNANGAAYNALTIAKLKLMLCPLPPLSLQQSFAHKIEQIERQKAAVQSTITDLETLLAARMQYWFD